MSQLTTEERSLSRQELRALWRRSLRRPGCRRHPQGDQAGLITLKAAVTMVLLDHAGIPTTSGSGKEGPHHG